MAGDNPTQGTTRRQDHRVDWMYMKRARRHRKTEAIVAALLAIGRRCAAALKGPAIDHAALLYDQRGLPK
jgi:hypothetical protein